MPKHKPRNWTYVSVAAISCFICLKASEAGDKVTYKQPKQVKIPRDGIVSASYENKLIFNNAARIFEPSQRKKFTLSKARSNAEQFIPFQKELYSTGTTKTHYDTVVAAQSFNSAFLDATQLGMRSGDIAVLDRSGKRLVLVFVGDHAFTDGKKQRSFFLYPYVKEAEYNTFPPRLHSELVKLLKRDSSPLKLKYRTDKNRSWLRTSLAGTQNKVFLKSRWRGKVGTNVSVYRLKKGAVKEPRLVFLKRPKDLLCHHQVTGLSCTWACLAQANAYVEKSSGLRQIEIDLTNHCLFGANFKSLYESYSVFAAVNEVRAILPQDFRPATATKLQQAGFTAQQIAVIRNSSEGVDATDSLAMLGPMLAFYANHYASRTGGVASGVIRFTYMAVSQYSIRQDSSFGPPVSRLISKEAKSPGFVAKNKSTSDVKQLIDTVKAFASNAVERKFLSRVAAGIVARPTFLGDYFKDAGAVLIVWNELAVLRRTSGQHVSLPAELLPIILKQLRNDRPIIVGVDIPPSGTKLDSQKCPLELADAYSPVVFSASKTSIPHAVLVIGYADLNDGQGYIYFQDGQRIAKGSPVGSIEKKADFENRVPHISKMRIDDFVKHLHQANYWDDGNQKQHNVEVLKF